MLYLNSFGFLLNLLGSCFYYQGVLSIANAVFSCFSINPPIYPHLAVFCRKVLCLLALCPGTDVHPGRLTAALGFKFC